MSERSRDRTCMAAVLVTAFAAFVLSPISYHADMVWTIHTALSLTRGHWGDLSIFPLADPERFGSLVRAGTHVYLVFPWGTSLLLVPMLWIAELVAPQYMAFVEAVNPQSGHRLFASLIAAAAVAIFYAAARERFARPVALAMAVIFAFCTPMWSTASRVLWSHGPLILAYCTAMLLMLRAERRPGLAAAAAIPLAIGFMIRPTAALGIVAIGALIALAHPRVLAGYLLLLALTLAPWIALNLAVFDAVMPPYYLPSRLTGSATVAEALAGNLVSPARGLLVFSPILLVALPGFALALRAPRERALALALGTLVVAHWIVVSRFPHWWGGASFGPRLMSDIVPFATFLAGTALAKLAERPRPLPAAAVLVLALASAAIHAQGAVVTAGPLWNRWPLSVDEHPDRLWDWHDPQVIAGLRRWRGLP